MHELDPAVVKDLTQRLSRIEGQARGLQRMLAEGRPCEDILTQLSAMRAAIGTVATKLLVENLQNCLLNGNLDGTSAESLERAKKLFAGFVK